ncbi:MAG: hypothetical protein U0836_20105 [Pirellulales bacterium]
MDDQTKLLTEIRDLLRSQDERLDKRTRGSGLKYTIGGLLVLMTLFAIVFGAYRAGYVDGQRTVMPAVTY